MENNSINVIFSSILDSICDFKNSITILQNQVKLLEKKSNKKIRKLERELEKKKKNRKKNPSGFAKPSKISDKLCEFLNKPHGSEVARTEVTQYLISYIKENKLQNENNKQFIEPDKKLKNLLETTNNENITYFNIQSHMNKHFLKSS